MIDETLILAKLDTLLSAITNVQEVYQGIPSTNGKYPAIFLHPEGWREEYADLRDTNVIYEFKIVVLVNLDGDTLVAQSTLRAITKAARETLGSQANITLDGLIDSSRLVSGQFIYDQNETKQAMCQMSYTVRKRFSRH